MAGKPTYIAELIREAKAAGRTRYFTGKPCRNGHVAERLVSTRDCVQCSLERTLSHRKAHPEHRKQSDAQYRERHRERVNAASISYYWRNAERLRPVLAQWAKKNPERAKAAQIVWKAANFAKRNAHEAKRRARKLQATPKWANTERIEAFYRTADALNMLTGDWHHVDHVVPLQGKTVCGLHNEFNLQILSGAENRSKSNRFWPDMP